MPGNLAQALDALNFAGRDPDLDARAASKVQKVRDTFAPLREPFEMEWALAKAAYLTQDIGSNYAGHTRNRIPKAFILNERVVPRVVSATVGRGAFFEAVPRKGDQQRAADLQRDLLSWQLEECGFRRKYTPMVRSASIAGSTIVKRRWRYDLARVRTVRKVGEETTISEAGVGLEPQFAPEDKVRVIFDGPDADEIDLFSVFFDPRGPAGCLEGTDILEERRVTRTWLMKEARAGRIRNLEKVFSEVAGSPASTGDQTSSAQVQRDMVSGLAQTPAPQEREYVYRECWCEFALEAQVGREDEAETEACLLVTVNGIPVRIGGNPMPDQKAPFYLGVLIQVPGRRYGLSLTGTNLGLFIEANDTRNMASDAKALAMLPMLTTRDPKMTGKVVEVEAGRIIVDPTGALKPITLTDTSPSGYLAEDVLNRDLEDAFGAPSTYSGQPLQGGGGSATEVATTTEQANVRIAAYGATIEETLLRPLLCGMANDNRQFLDEAKQIRVEGEDGFDWPWITPEDAQAECDFIMLGASQMLTRFVLGAQYGTLVPVMQAVEQQALATGQGPMFDWTFIFRTLFRDVFGFPHPELAVMPRPSERGRPKTPEEMLTLISQGHRPRIDERTDFQNALQKTAMFLRAVEGRIDYRLERQYRDFLLDLWAGAQKKIALEQARMEEMAAAGAGAPPGAGPPSAIGPAQRDGQGAAPGRRLMVAARGGPAGRGAAA